MADITEWNLGDNGFDDPISGIFQLKAPLITRLWIYAVLIPTDLRDLQESLIT